MLAFKNEPKPPLPPTQDTSITHEPRYCNKYSCSPLVQSRHFKHKGLVTASSTMSGKNSPKHFPGLDPVRIT